MPKSILFIIAISIGISFISPAKANSTNSPPSQPVSNKMGYSSLTAEEREILDRGEIDTGQYIAGGIVGTLFGLVPPQFNFFRFCT